MKIPKEIKTVIFDLDGLLLDSEPAWAEADTELLGKRGFSPTPELFVKRLGTGPRQTIEIYKEEFGITEDTKSLLDERLHLFFEKLENNLVLMEGGEELVEKLFKTNKKLAIATSGPYKNKIYDYIKRLNLENYFSVVITGEDIKKPKPDPEIFLLASEKLGISTEQCLVLEDAPNGVKAGKAAGMLVYGINKDTFTANELQKAGADEVFSSLSEIIV